MLLLRASIRRLQARPALAKPWAEAGLEVATRLDARRLQGIAHIHLEAIAQELGLHDRQHHEGEAIRLLSDAGADGLLATILLNSAFARHESGEWAEALERLDRAAAAFQRVGQGVDEVLSRSTAAMIMVLQGAHLEARRQLAVADRISRTLGWRQGRAYAGYGLAFLDAAAGDLTTARRGFDEAEAVFAAEGIVPFVHEVRRWRAEALLRAGAAQECLEIVDGLISDAARPPDPPLDLAALRLRGHALAVLGRTDEAARQVDEALNRAGEVGYAYEVALSLWAMEGLGAQPLGLEYTARRLRIFAELGITDGLTLAPCVPSGAPETDSGP